MLFFTVSIGLAILLVILVVLKHIYRYVSDPKGLRRFPGMTFFALFTNIPCMLYSTEGRRFMAIHDAHQRLGPIVRVGPNSVSFNDVAAVKDIYGHGSPVRKGEFYDTLAGSHRHLADVSDRDEHSRKRRVLAGAYSQAALENWEHIVAERTAALVKQYDRLCLETHYHATLHASPGMEGASRKGYINHRHWMILFAQDAIAQIGLTADLKMLETGNYIVTIRDLNGKLDTFSYREALWRSHLIQNRLVWSPAWFKWLTYVTGWHPYWADHNRYTNLCVYLVQQQLKRYLAGEKIDDPLRYIFEDKYGNSNNYPIGEMVAETSIMLNAGSDTTGIALTNVLYWLLKNPTCLAKLRAEIDSVLDEDEAVVPYDKIKHLPYLRACLDESLRLTPPNTMSVNRLTPPEGMSIMGHLIAGNTTVHAPPYAMHRNADVFPDPESFDPERWVGEKAKALQPYFITFSAGARGCIGRNITYLEQTVALASMINRYEFELPSNDWVLSQKEAFTCSPGDMPVRIRMRRL
ncbi:benzoate 4-monooxygenase cytochrome p450 [Penicillium macrosclerotiorum]|uniref:benzoate 4-monooxygenase cytochrome p450 n=1 Tax=Penicillium macrosclerotiorum TaxID=303699 RepID=UPI002548FFD2|nr:benzoate 4-monooxygenase cytochrome p450 [Penicillium macrosclerotiorum]KAJ5688856.1 benzoate 4-monooxygenase cytochrome p450 [Penicillium macrosclerotiorum]